MVRGGWRDGLVGNVVAHRRLRSDHLLDLRVRSYVYGQPTRSPRRDPRIDRLDDNGCTVGLRSSMPADQMAKPTQWEE